MKNLTKKFIALFLVVAFACSAAACYSEDNLWAAKKDDLTLPTGGYIYYLYAAYSAAAPQVSKETNILKATIADKKAEDWIREKAIESVKEFYFVHQKFNELGLTLTDDDQSTIDSYMTYYWGYGQSTTYEGLGISEASLRTVGPEYSVMQQKVFEAIYGKDGEKAVSDADLTKYYEDNYFSYEYFTASLSKTGDDGSSVDLTDEEKAALKKQLDTMKSKIEAGDLTVTDAATDYQTSAGLEASTYNSSTDLLSADSYSDVPTAAKALADNAVTVVESTTSYSLVRRIPIKEKTAEMLETDSSRSSTLSSFKGEEFSEYIKEQAKSMEGITYNEKAMNMFKLSKLVTDDNKKGTSSTASETSSAVSGESSVAGESSAVSSESSAVSSEASAVVSSEASAANSESSAVSSEASTSSAE